MKIEKDGEEGIVIEISPMVQWSLIGLLVGLLVVGIWKFVLWKTEKPGGATLTPPPPPPAPVEEPMVAHTGAELLEVERDAGIDDSPRNIEKIMGADRQTMEKVYQEVLSSGTPDLDSEGALLFRGLVEQSVRVAPNRSLRFYSHLDNNEARLFAQENLYHFWFQKNFDEAAASLPNVGGTYFQRNLYRSGLLDLASRDGKLALEKLKAAKQEWFGDERLGLHRALFRYFGTNDLAMATKGLADLTPAQRREAIQGVALGRLDVGWSEAVSWARQLSGEDRVVGLGTVAELGIQQHPTEAPSLIASVPGGAYRTHLERSMEVKRRVMAFPPSDREKRTLRLYRSHQPEGDFHGLAAIGNALENAQLRDRYSRLVRYRLPEFASQTIKEGTYCLLSETPPNLNHQPFQDLLEMGQKALSAGKLSDAKHFFELYFTRNPQDPEALAAMTELAKARKTWLGDGGAILSGVKIAPAKYEDVSMSGYLQALCDRVQAEKHIRPEVFMFQAVVGGPLDTTIFLNNEQEITAKQAVEALNEISGLMVSVEEFGIVVYGYRDEEEYLFTEPREVD